MNDIMSFPPNFELFISQYKFKDKEEFYTNGSDLIQVFRVMQAWDHYTEEMKSKSKYEIFSRDRAIVELYSLVMKLVKAVKLENIDVETARSLNSLYDDIKQFHLDEFINSKDIITG